MCILLHLKSGQEYNPLQYILKYSCLFRKSPQLEYGGVHAQWVVQKSMLASSMLVMGTFDLSHMH